MLKKREGLHIPDVVFKTRENGEFVDIHSNTLFENRGLLKNLWVKC